MPTDSNQPAEQGDERREAPQYVYDFINSLGGTQIGARDTLEGATAAERHRIETGHRLEFGCCARKPTTKPADAGSGDD